jgi:hypothetical protein
LKEAVAYHTPRTEANGNDILTAADMFYDWLLKGERTRTFPATAPPPATEAAPAPPQEKTTPALNTKPTCPKCGKPDFVYTSRDEGGGWFCWKSKGGCGENWKGTPVSTKSVMEQAYERLDRCLKVTDIMDCSAWMRGERAKNVLENAELYKLDKYSIEKAIALGKAADDYDVTDSMVKQLRDQRRFNDSDVVMWLSKIDGKRQAGSFVKQAEELF